MKPRSTLSQQPKKPSFFTPISDRFSYDRLNRLGGGTYGTVYMGRDAEGGAVAVKVIQRSNLYRLKWEGTELVEVSMLRRLSGQHPNMLRFVACVGSRFTSEVFIFTELCEKGALTKLITRLTELETFLLFKQLVEGMEFLHQQNIMHHDLKPDNLLVTANNQLKIADFGSARWSDALINSLPKYTPFYASPEVFLSEKFDKKCDVFSAGYILYQMLAGERLNKQVKNIDSFFQKYRTTGFIINHPAISPAWAAIIRSMLNFDPDKRPTFTQLRLIMRDFQTPLDRLPPSRSPSSIEVDLSNSHLQSIIEHVRAMQVHNNYLVNILRVFKHFETEKSLLIPRIYKIILLYLSLSLYCLLSEDTLSQLDHKSALVVQGKTVQEMEESLTVQDRAILDKILKEARERVNVGKEQMKDYVRRKVVGDITKGNDRYETLVLQQLQISEGVQQMEQGQPGVAHFYRERISRCANNLFQTAEELQVLGNADLACYLTLLCVSQVALDSSSSSHLPPRLSTILQLSPHQLLTEISKRKPQ